MSEVAKTGIYVGVAALVGIVAFLVRPQVEPIQVDELVGKPLFAKFKEPAEAASLKITVFDEELSTTEKFEVAKKEGTDLWVIPSSEDYPADAEEQIRDAALSFIDLKALGVVSEIAEDHAALGVVEPSESSAASAAEGVGTHVVIRDKGNKDVANLIIGKEVKDQPELRFVRKPSQDVVYVAKIDPAKFSTEFHDWIDTELLEVKPFDISTIQIQDYSIVQTTQRPVLKQRLDVLLEYDETSGEWALNRMVEFEQGQPKSADLGPEEELDTQRLNEMRNAFADLEIVDVHRKPEGLGADLQATQRFMNNTEAVRSLIQKGFYPQPTSGSNQFEVLAENGEVVLGTKDGIEYVMRFGRTSATQESAKEGKLNRSLFVTARLNESMFQPPEKPALPQEGDGPEAPAAPTVEPADEEPAAPPQPTSEQPAPEQPASEQPASEQPAPEDPATDEPADEQGAEPEEKPEDPEDSAEGEGACDEDEASDASAQEPTETDTSSPPDTSSPDTPAAPEEKPAVSEEQPGDSPADEKPADADTKQEKPAEKDAAEADMPPTTQPPAAQPSKTELELERARVEKAYQRQLDEYEERLRQARGKVAAANGRFAEWYYVIPEDVYEKVHLGRAEIVKEKGAEGAAAPGGMGPGGAPFNPVPSLQGLIPE